MQLSDLGRESVTRRVKGAGKLSFEKEVEGGGFWNLRYDMLKCWWEGPFKGGRVGLGGLRASLGLLSE